MQELFTAILNENADAVSEALANGVSPNICLESDRRKPPALVFAARMGSLTVLNVLLQAGADINARDKYKTTALMEAAQGGFTQLVAALLQRKAKVNLKEQFGGAALHFALQFAKDRLYRGGVLNTQKQDAQEQDAVLATTEEIVQQLLEHGADVNKRTNVLAGKYAESSSVLYFACQLPSARLVKLILDHGAVLDSIGETNSPLLPALTIGNIEILELLAQHGANFDAAVYDDKTPLQLVIGNQQLHLISWLVNHGANINALHELLANGADLTLRNQKRHTALSITYANRQQHLAEYFLQAGASRHH